MSRRRALVGRVGEGHPRVQRLHVLARMHVDVEVKVAQEVEDAIDMELGVGPLGPPHRLEMHLALIDGG